MRGSPSNAEHPTHTHAPKAARCCFKTHRWDVRPDVAIWWQAQGFVCCVRTCRAGSEAKEHHYGLNTTKTKHRLSGAPQSAQLRLRLNRGRGGSRREKQPRTTQTIRATNLLKTITFTSWILHDPPMAPSLKTRVVSANSVQSRSAPTLRSQTLPKIQKCQFEFWGNANKIKHKTSTVFPSDATVPPLKLWHHVPSMKRWHTEYTEYTVCVTLI